MLNVVKGLIIGLMVNLNTALFRKSFNLGHPRTTTKTRISLTYAATTQQYAVSCTVRLVKPSSFIVFAEILDRLIEFFFFPGNGATLVWHYTHLPP